MQNKTKIASVVALAILVATSLAFVYFYAGKYPNIKEEARLEKESAEQKDGKLSDEEIFKEEYVPIDERFLIARGMIADMHGGIFDLKVDFKEGESDYIFKDKETVSFKPYEGVVVRKFEGQGGEKNEYDELKLENVSAGDYVEIYFSRNYAEGLVAEGIQIFDEKFSR